MEKNDLKDQLEFPKIREGVEAIPYVYQGQQCILLKDQLGYSDRSLLLSSMLIPILVKMDGNNSIKDLQVHFMRTTGQFIMREKLEKLINELEESLFLDTERFKTVKKKLMEDFIGSPLRKAVYAGKSYPNKKEELKKLIDSFFDPEKGGPGDLELKVEMKEVVGLVVPHIDLNLGGSVYAHGYKRLLHSKIPDIWIVLGTSHGTLENLFAITYKDFETPFGVLRTDKELVSFIKEKIPFDLFKDEFSHRNEHTIEFQAIFLSHFWPDIKIVPILCYFDVNMTEEEKSKVEAMVKVLKELVTQRSVGLIASVDLAHVGPRYGDRFIPNRDIIESNLDMDRLLLDLLSKTDGDRFLEILKNENNKRKICGLAPLYVLVKAFEGLAKGETVAHSYGFVDDQNSFVTYASMVFYRES